MKIKKGDKRIEEKQTEKNVKRIVHTNSNIATTKRENPRKAF